MKKILLTSLLCSVSLFSASNPSNLYGYEVTPFVSGILTDSKAGLDNNNYLNAGIALGKNIDDSFIDQVEIAYMRSDSLEYDGTNGNTNVNRAFLNAVKKFALTEKLSAYGLAGFVEEKEFCPACKSHMVLTKNARGTAYLKCSNKACKETKYLTVDLMNWYISSHNVGCPKHDGGELKGRLGKYGPYVTCTCGHTLKPHDI